MQLNNKTKARQVIKSEDGHDGYMIKFPDGYIWTFYDHFAWFMWRREFADKIPPQDLRRTRIRLAA